jgi:hypothetical protein
MTATDKPLVWLHGEVKTPPFSRDARIEAGYLLRRLLRGEKLVMPQSRPMGTIGRTPEYVKAVCRQRLKRYDDA